MEPTPGSQRKYALLGTALVALVSSYFLASSSNAPLYCVTRDSPFSISTLNASLPQAQCFRVKNGLFSEVIEKPAGDSYDQPIFLDGYVIPGIIESHGHILQYGEMLESVQLYGAESVDEVRSRIKDFLKAHVGEGYGTKKKWIRGIGWDQQYFDGVMPTAKELGEDPELASLYIMLDRVDVHCVWTSTKVLELLPAPLPEAPPGGVIVSDPGLGVFCDNAMDGIILPIAPKPDSKDRSRWLRAAMKELNKVGIVGVGNAGIRADDVSILESMVEMEALTIRINVMLECIERNTFCPLELTELNLLKSSGSMGGGSLILGGVKLFADGALGSWGAALLKPYADKPDTSGTMIINETALTAVVGKWFNAGFQVNVHAIGDRANRAAIDAFESVLGAGCEGCNDAKRLRIEHAQIIHPDDQKRIKKMGIIPSIQPTHATSDMAYAADRLGKERLTHSAYRMASLFPTTAKGPTSKYPGPVLGSDFPVEPANPFHGMYAAVTRLNPLTGESPAGPNGWYPEEALTVEQAVLGFTKNAAYGWNHEGKSGAIEVGKWADFVVINKDIWADKTGKSLRDVEVLQTWVGGKKVYPVPVKEDWVEALFLSAGDAIINLMPTFVTGVKQDPNAAIFRPITTTGNFILRLLPRGLTGIEADWKDPNAERTPTWLERNLTYIRTWMHQKIWQTTQSAFNIWSQVVAANPLKHDPEDDRPLLDRIIKKTGTFILGLLPEVVIGDMEGFGAPKSRVPTEHVEDDEWRII